MIEIIVNIALLTLIFTVSVLGTLFIRKYLNRGRENVICVIWAAVLIISVIPFYNSRAVIRLPSFESEVFTASENKTSDRIGVAYATKSHGYRSLTELQKDLDRVRKVYGDSIRTVTYDTGEISSNANDEYETLYTVLSALLFAVWIVGAIVSFLKPFRDFFAVSRVLTLNSSVSLDPRINRIFDQCREELGIKRKIPLRVVYRGCACSPCAAGLLIPCVYMGYECLSYSDLKLRFIFTHELCHIRRNDIIFKFFTLAVSSFHWFNPLAHILPQLVCDDCELACDNAVIKIFGREAGDAYMITILDIAESICCQQQKLIYNMDGGMFISGGQGRHFLEKRYTNMKIENPGKAVIAAAAIFIAIVFIMNSVIISSFITPSFAKEGAGELPSGSTGNVFLDEALRGYFNLTSDMPITEEMLEAVVSFGVRMSYLNSNTYFDGGKVVYVDYIVNGKEICAFPLIMHRDRFNEAVEKIEAVYGGTENKKGRSTSKISNFYSKLDIFCSDKEKKNELIYEISRALVPEITLSSEFYSGCSDEFSLVFFDLYSSEREIANIAQEYRAAGLLDNYSLINGIFDASCLNILPNLKSFSCEGIAPVNLKKDFSLEKTIILDYDAEEAFNIYRENYTDTIRSISRKYR